MFNFVFYYFIYIFHSKYDKRWILNQMVKQDETFPTEIEGLFNLLTPSKQK